MTRTMIVFIALFLTACASPFQAFESATQACRAQGLELMYRTETFEPVACMSDRQFTAFERQRQLNDDLAKAARPPYDPAVESARSQADALSLQNLLLLQSVLNRGNIFEPYHSPPPYEPVPFRQPFTCSTIRNSTTCW